MREWIKSYHIFLPGRWGKWILYLLIPAFFFVIGFLLEMKFININFSTTMILTSSLIVSVEIYLDYFIFGGIASKNTNKLEYLKTSVKGLSVLKKGLIMDAIRRFSSISIIILGLSYIYHSLHINRKTITLIFFYFLLIELAFIATRHFSYLALIAAIAIIASLLAYPITIWILEANPVSPITISILAILGICIGTGSRILILKKARDSYYDERN